MIRLSIIVPFYNVEKYIEQCIRSLYNQDIPQDEYEVICVDDASPDGSRAIVERLQQEYPTLKLLTHEVNKKLGAARNTGRREARGKYIWNVDSDDRIVPNCLGEILEQCERNDLDVLVFKAYLFQDVQTYNQPDFIPSTKEPMKGLDYMSSLDEFATSILCPVWNKIIKRDLLDTHRIYSPEVNMGEDVPYSFSVMMCAERIMVTEQKYYCYRQNPSSLTGKEWTPQVHTLYEKCLQNSGLIYNVAKRVPRKYYKVQKMMFSVANFTFLTLFRYFPNLSCEEQKQFKTLCQKRVFKDIHVFSILSTRKCLDYYRWLFRK